MARYVGKRVVPKHCGYWDGAKPYEMQNIVYDRASGNSYISRRAVPAGTDISQEEYWAPCSDFNEQMDLLDKNMAASESRIKADNAATERNIREDNAATERNIREDNDATEAAIRADNAATAKVIKEDNASTLESVNGRVDAAEAAMALQKASFDEAEKQLNARMDSVLAAGTGEGDTEIVDARVDADGTDHGSVGSHIRSILPKAAAESEAIFNSRMAEQYAAGILETAEEPLHRGSLHYPYSTSTFSGWVSEYELPSDVQASGLRFVVRAREDPVTQVRVRIAVGERSDSAVVSDITMGTDIQPEETKTLECRLPSPILPKGRKVYIAVETDAICSQGFGSTVEEETVSWYATEGRHPALENYQAGTKYRLFLELSGYEDGRFLADGFREWEERADVRLDALEGSADSFHALEDGFRRADVLENTQDLLPVSNPKIMYDSSTFTGWAAPIGKAKNFDTAVFSIKNRSTDAYLEAIRCVVAKTDKAGEALADDTQAGWHIAPGETREVTFIFPNAIENAKEEEMYFAFECDQYISVVAGSCGLNLNPPDYGKVSYLSYTTAPPFATGMPLTKWTDIYDANLTNQTKMQVTVGRMKERYLFGEELVGQVRGLIRETEELTEGQAGQVGEIVRDEVPYLSPLRVVLPDVFHAVAGDTLQLFYRGLVEHPWPYVYNIEFKCDIGKNTARYFEVTPTEGEAGDHTLTVNVRDHLDRALASAKAILRVHRPPASPPKQVGILCVGDSLTSSGIWCAEAMRRLTEPGGSPAGLCLSNIRFIGTRKNGDCGYEGYGGWTWASYLAKPSETTLGMWAYGSHDKDASDQHSLWKDASGNLWSMETIEAGRVKFTRYNSHAGKMPTGAGSLTHYQNAAHTADFEYSATAYADANPFWDSEEGQVDFRSYCERNGFPGIDYVYTLLTWNGLGGYYPEPDSTAAAAHVKNAKALARRLHEQYPDAKVKMMGIQMPSLNGGTGQNYGANSAYSNWYSLVRSVMGMNLAYQAMANEDEFKGYVEFINVSAQFDSENNMPQSGKPVNTRSTATEMVGTNGVHPSNDGYLQIGDAAYRSMAGELAQ